jgi:hypothetical protein
MDVSVGAIEKGGLVKDETRISLLSYACLILDSYRYINLVFRSTCLNPLDDKF